MRILACDRERSYKVGETKRLLYAYRQVMSNFFIKLLHLSLGLGFTLRRPIFKNVGMIIDLFIFFLVDIEKRKNKTMPAVSDMS